MKLNQHLWKDILEVIREGSFSKEINLMWKIHSTANRSRWVYNFLQRMVDLRIDLHVWYKKPIRSICKVLLHDAIFLATCNAILLLIRDVKLASTSLHYIFLMNSLQVKQSSLIYMSWKQNCVASCKKDCIV